MTRRHSIPNLIPKTKPRWHLPMHYAKHYFNKTHSLLAMPICLGLIDSIVNILFHHLLLIAGHIFTNINKTINSHPLNTFFVENKWGLKRGLPHNAVFCWFLTKINNTLWLSFYWSSQILKMQHWVSHTNIIFPSCFTCYIILFTGIVLRVN